MYQSIARTLVQQREKRCKGCMKAKVGEMFSIFQNVNKRKPSNHRHYVNAKFLGTPERISTEPSHNGSEQKLHHKYPKSKAEVSPSCSSTSIHIAEQMVSEMICWHILHWQQICSTNSGNFLPVPYFDHSQEKSPKGCIHHTGLCTCLIGTLHFACMEEAGETSVRAKQVA